MNREIKFRGLYNGQWVYGSLIKRTIKGQIDYQIEHADFDDFSQYDVAAESVGEYVGMTDTNGVEIYEGDCCTVEFVHATFHGSTIKHKGQVVFRKGAFWLESDARQSATLSAYDFRPGRCEITVTGNIYQNPELLNP